MAFPKAIITKPFLISTAEYQEVGQNITLVGYDEFSQKMQESRNHASPRLLNWVEPYELSGERKTLFYTEVNSNIKVGDKVFIINGSYDSNLLIKKDKYKKGRDGYSVLRVEGCKIVLDISYTGTLPYKDEPIDDFIKVYYIDSEETFVAANRQMTTRGGKLDYKFNYGQNNIAFIDKSYGPIEEWGRNGGVYGVPGFFVREENTYLSSGVSIKEQWNNISDKLVYLGSFSVALSSTYKNNGKMLIMNGSFEYKGMEFREGVAYSWNEKKNVWESDPEYSAPIISKSNFRAGTFKGKFNNGAYGSLDKKISWTGKGTWNGGTILNSKWESGTMNSSISISPSVKAERDQYGIPFQKPNTSNNAGFGYNYVIGCDIDKSIVENGNFFGSKFTGDEGTYSVVEGHILNQELNYDNTINKAFFDSCEFRNIHIKSGEVKNTKAVNSRFTNIKALNSYFENSVMKDSTYVGDGVMKIIGYDEWNMSEYRSRTSGTYSYINQPNSKIYKFYISKESFDRMKAKDTFFIKGLKMKNSSRDMILDFFDSRFRLSTWTAYYDDLSISDPSLTRTPRNSFYKRGYEIAAFLSTPEENSYAISSYEDSYMIGGSGSVYLKYRSEIVGPNAKKGYSIDIVVSRHDIFNKRSPLDRTSERIAPIPRDYNYGTDVATGTASMPNYIGDMVDFSNAYIIDADFHSGYIETSDWNSGYHINFNNDVALVGPTSTGRYAISIDNLNDHLVVETPFNTLFSERPGEDSVLHAGEVVYLNAVDYDNRGMVAKVTLMATGSSYSTTNSTDPARLVNTKISGTTMSSVGSGYLSDVDVATLTKTGSGSGLTLNISAKPIGSVISITYSAPMTAGGSYSLNLSSAVSTNTGPIATASFVYSILVDYNGSITGVVNATYSVFGPTLSAATASAVANAIYATGPASSIESGLTVRYYTQTNGAISSLSVENPGIHYKVGQTFVVAGGNATFSIESISYGEITSYSIANPGEDYIVGDIVEIPKKFDPNSSLSGTTASITVTSITASYYDYKGLSLDITAESGSIVGITISNPGLFYEEGEIYTILGGNLNAIVKIESVTGSMVRLSDAYKIVDNSQGTIRLKELATQSVIAGLTGGGIFYTAGANNRWNYMSKLKIDRSKIKSGIFRRPYITRSLIRDAGYVSADRDFTDSAKIKNLMVADAIFSSSGNILSSATYMHSSFCAGSDIWNDGIIFRSVINGMTFSKGTVKTSMWMNGTFNGGTFYDSRSFNAQPGIYERSYESDSLWLYYVKGEVNAIPDTVPVFNGRHAWINGTFNGGEFFKSDWNSGTFNNGLFYNSKFYSGTINNGIIGTKNVAASDTKIYSGTINYATVNNAYVYADDSGYEGLSYSLIQWNDGIFNSGVFGSNNDRLLGWTISTTKYDAYIGALPIKDYKITIATVSVTDTTPITGEFDIEVGLTLKHTYIGDLIINLMAPNGKIINLKKKYSGGSNDNMVGSVFTSDEDAPSIDIWYSPYTGKFKFSNLIGQGVYYNLQGRSISGAYKAPTNELATIKGYISYIPSPAYDGDRWLVVATASDPTWNGQTNLFSSGFRNSIVEWKSATGTWIFPQDDSGRVLDDPKEGDIVTTESGETIVYYKSSWTKSYHSNTRKISDLLDSDKSIEGEWKLLVMDDAGIDIGFVDEFYVTFSYKNSYLIKSYKSDAIWYNGIFNGGQFVDLGIWKDGTFNGGKFISTYGWTSSGNYLNLEPSTDTFTWQDGIFNGGEFGNESLQANSTWRKGEFNGGIFKGRLWNDGIFTYGEFKGGSSLPAVGSTIDSESAQAFISEFIEGNYYGAWRKGMVSEKKDDFVTDKKLFTALQRSVKPVEKGKKAVFTNMLWLGGIFNHQAGEIKNSLWLDGLFKNGKMEGSAFNPYVRRYSDIREFSKDDSSIWENGRFSNGEFHYSKWMQGKFISGTAVGMIWKNGIANYMNAYNIFWENGIWRNGNWNGSYFDYSGKVEEEFAKEILNRGIEWSGTSSCHIWNMFESDADRTSRIVTSDPAQDSFATDNVDDAGVTPPFFTDPSNGVLGASNYNIGNAQITFTVEVNMGGGTLSHVGIAYTTSGTTPVPEDPIAVATVNTSGTVVINTSGTTKYKGISIYNNLTGQNNANISITSQPAALNVVSGIFQITVTGLLSTNYYNFMAFAANREGVTTQILRNIQTTMPLTVPNAVVLDVGTPANPHPTSGSGNLEIPTTYKDPNPQSSLSDHNGNTDKVGVQFNVANNDGSQPATLSKSVTHVLNSAGQLSTYVTTISTNNSTGTFKVRIPYGTGQNDLQGNTKYWFRTWISNEAGPVYSQVSSFTTGALPPAITQFTNPTTAAASTSLTMEIDNNGSSTLHAGFRIWLNSAFPANNVLANSISGNNILLSPWSGGTGLTSFYTVYTTTSTQGVQTITLSLASLLAAGTLSPNTNYKVIGFAYDPNQSVVVSPNQTSPHLFKTDSLPAGVDTLVAMENDSDGAKMRGELTSTGGHIILQRGFVYKRTASGQPYPSLTGGAAATESIGVDSGIVTVTGIALGLFEEAVNGLMAAEEYQYRAYVITSAPTPASVFYGSQMLFETAATATISARSNSAPSISARSLSATTTVSPGGLSATATLQISTGTGTSFGPSIVTTSLLPNKRYYVRAKTVLASGVTWYSTPEETAWTLAHIVVNEAGVLGVSNITDSSATMTIKIPAAQGLLGQKGISVYPYGGDPASGNQQSISNPTIAGGEIYSSANATVPFTSLATGTRYEYTGYADAVAGALASPATTNPDGWNVNNSGASSIQRTYGSLFGEKADFWTKAKATTTSGSDTWTSNQLSLSFAISNAGGSSISEYGIIWKTGASPAAWTQAEVEAAVGDPQFVKIKREPQSPANISTSISATVTTAALTATTGAPGASDDLQIIAYVKNDAGIYADIAGQIFKNLA